MKFTSLVLDNHPYHVSGIITPGTNSFQHGSVLLTIKVLVTVTNANLLPIIFNSFSLQVCVAVVQVYEFVCATFRAYDSRRVRGTYW